MASVRYRAILPALGLEQLGYTVMVSENPGRLKPRSGDVLIVVKSFAEADRQLIASAKAKGALVIFDLCDNVFVPNYSAKGGLRPADVLDQWRSSLDLLVVPTAPLAAVVRQALEKVRVEVIPDPIETPESKKDAIELIGRAQGGFLLRIKRMLSGRAGKHSPAGPEKQVEPDIPPGYVIAWFGNHGAPYGSFGLSDIGLFASALQRAAEVHNARLIVVSNNREKYLALAPTWPIQSDYFEWSQPITEAVLARADVCIIPNSLDEFAFCKSANRTLLSLQAGCPVVATPTESLEAIGPGVWANDPTNALLEVLADPTAARAQARVGFVRALDRFSVSAIAQHWDTLIQSLVRDRAKSRQVQGGKPVVGLVVDLLQDWDIAEPLIDALRREGSVPYLLVSTDLKARGGSRIWPLMKASQCDYTLLPDKFTQAEAVIALKPLAALVTCAESNLSPHRFAHRLTKFALLLKKPCFTQQHGFDNVGLTYSDEVQPITEVSPIAGTIFVWGPLQELHQDIQNDIRRRCVPVGCPKPARRKVEDIAALKNLRMPVVGVFENLHWHRYSDTYRTAFIDVLDQLCESIPEVAFLIKPHSGGLWLTKRYKGPKPCAPNLIVADPKSVQWQKYTAPDFFPYLCAVISTPSTVVLDSARYGLPTLLCGLDVDFPRYEPLLRFDGAAQAIDKVRSLAQRDLLVLREFEEAQAAFLARVLVPGDGATNIAQAVLTQVR
jgi:glycosyltransferase involved in cell wall biosynthesis